MPTFFFVNKVPTNEQMLSNIQMTMWLIWSLIISVRRVRRESGLLCWVFFCRRVVWYVLVRELTNLEYRHVNVYTCDIILQYR